MSEKKFREAGRAQVSMLAPLEKKALIWLAHRTPAAINSDHLTALGLVAMLGAGAAYWYASHDKTGLLLVIFFLIVNWYGDSLDGTLARVRDKQRPRYGFYVDHVVDALGTTCLLGGMALSGYMTVVIALCLLICYFLLSIEVYLATYTIGTFHLSFWKFSPTELRILLAIGALAAYLDPGVVPGGGAYRAFDIGGWIGLAAMIVMLFVAITKHTLHLYRAEPID
jgi:phosphatidylglycerophosphate synthase